MIERVPNRWEGLRARFMRSWREIFIIATLAGGALTSSAIKYYCDLYDELPHSDASGFECEFPGGVEVYASQGLVPVADIRRAATILVTSPYEKWFQGGIYLRDGRLEVYGGFFPQQPRLITSTPTP